MNNNILSPYIRKAIYCDLPAYFRIARRIIFDYEIIYVSGGGARLIIGDREYVCKKGDVVFLRPGVSHELTYYKDVNFLQPHIHFDAVYNKNSERTPICFKDTDALSEDEKALIQEDIIEKSIPYVFVPCDGKRFGRVFFEIIELYKNKPQRFELTSKIKMLELLSLIFEQFEVKETVSEASENDPAVTVKNYIDNNFMQPITLEGLQNQFYINKYTLIRNFNKLYHQSPISYCNDRRLEYAQNQLVSTNRSVTSIAEQLGYDSGSFNRFFRKHFGVSPGEYRKSKNKAD